MDKTNSYLNFKIVKMIEQESLWI